jgi:hypothetical protein
MIYTDIRIFLQHVALRFEIARIDGKLQEQDRIKWLAGIAKNCRRYKNADPVVRELCKQMWKYRVRADWMFDQYYAMIYDCVPHKCSHQLDANVRMQYDNPDFDPQKPFAQHPVGNGLGLSTPLGAF